MLTTLVYKYHSVRDKVSSAKVSSAKVNSAKVSSAKVSSAKESDIMIEMYNNTAGEHFHINDIWNTLTENKQEH